MTSLTVLAVLLAVSVSLGAEPIALFAEKRLVSPGTVDVPFELAEVAAGEQVDPGGYVGQEMTYNFIEVQRFVDW